MNKKVVVLLALMSFSSISHAMDPNPWEITGGEDIFHQTDPQVIAAKIASKLALEAAKRAAEQAAKSEAAKSLAKEIGKRIVEVFGRITWRF